MPYKPDYSVSYGSKYEETKGLDITEVAKLIKKDLRAEFKGYKWSVTTERYSGGQSLKVKLKDAPSDFQLYNPEWLAHYEETGRYNRELEQYTGSAKDLMQRARAIVESYNYDGSDAMVDYFNVRFYESVKFDHTFAKARQESEMPRGGDEEIAEVKVRLKEARSLVDSLEKELERLEANFA